MLAEGMFIADRYEIVEKIGSGGMSDVYKAKDHVLGRFVAIKVLKKEFSEDVNFVTKFRTEAQSAARLEHPNIVNIYDVGSEYGMYYIVMEHVEGITLKSYIEKKGRLSYKEAVSIAIQVGRGIEAAHNKHIVHRDIKPQNIIISTEGKVKVTDFGIARAANNNTIHADVMGSVHYTSPEQARNGFVDGKSDIYSLGIVMYEMVTGRVPFDGDSTVAIAIQHLQDEMTPPSAYAPDLPISMEKIILKCTQKNPDRRYESISDLLVDLKKVLISPNEDFVIIAPVGQDKTRIIQKEDVAAIQQETGKAYYGDDEDSENEDGDEDGDEDDDEDGGFLNPKMEKAVTIMGIVAAVIIVAIIVVIIGSVSGLFKFGGNSNKNPNNTTQVTPNNNEDEPIKMIKVIGMTEKEARDALNKLGLGLKVNGSIASDDVDKNQIATQSIEEGTEVEKNTTVYVEICSGPGDVEVPSVTGLTEDQAKKKIEDKGFKASREYAYSDTVPEGEVVSQSPEAGKKAKKGDTITYYLSRGVETVKVPNVTNKSEEDAKKELEKAGFTVPEVTSEYNDTIPEGYVIRQTNAGEYKAKGTSIFLVISLGKQKTYYSYELSNVTPTISGDIPADIDVKDVVIRKGGEKIQATWKSEKKTRNGKSYWVIKVSDIEGVDRGTITIIWKGTSSSGSTEEITDEYYNEYSDYFQKQ